MPPSTISGTYSPASLKNSALDNPSEKARARDALPVSAQEAPGIVKKTNSDEVNVNPKDALNKAIIESQLSVSVATKNKPMELLYRTVIDALGEYVDPVLGEGAIQEAYDSGLDVSPEATAERIVSLSTAFIGAFKEQHPELEGGALVSRFLEVIGGGIEQGFTEARDILDGLDVLEGDIASNIDKTYELVQQGLKDFSENFLNDQKLQDV